MTVFLAAAAGGCLAIARLLPLPDVPQVREKIEWLRRHRGDYDTLFVGTSRVRRHLVPALFDRLAAEHGLPLRSFNLGVDSLAAPEDGYVLDLALAAAPPRLRYVFIELSWFRQNFAGQAADTVRAAYWHDGRRTQAIARQLAADFRGIKPLKKRKQEAWRKWSAEVAEIGGLAMQHAGLFCQRWTNLGRGAALVREAVGLRPPTDPLAPLGPGRDGFIPSETTISGPLLAEYERQFSTLLENSQRSQPLSPAAQANLEAMLARVRACGAEPVLFIAPTPAGTIFQPRRAVAPVLDFSSPREWPELFEPRYRADVTHLNTAGAEVFTRTFAEKFFGIARHPATRR